MSGTQTRPIVIGHRGACGERPEHTEASYRLAIAQGAGAIEPDLVMTKDGHLVCRHENEISGTTDVVAHAEFARRRTTKIIDGQSVEGWFTEDFTLAELKTLRCKERLPQLRPANMAYDGREPILTFAEALAIAREANVSIYPELKHPKTLAALGFDPMPPFIADVRAGGAHAADKLFVQCFDVQPLVGLAMMSSIRWNCVQLVAALGAPFDQPERSYAEMMSDEGLRNIARYARAIGVEKSLLLPRDATNRSLPATDLCARAHRAGLQVMVWTFRAENYFLPEDLRHGDPGASDFMRQHGDLAGELRMAYAAGVDGVFCDFPGLAVAARPNN